MDRKLPALALAMLLLSAIAACKSANPDDATKPAVAAASAWLALIDAGKAGEAWQNSDDAIKGAGTAELFAKMIALRRAPLGKETGRALMDKVYVKDPANAPAGEYVQIHFASSFENEKSQLETVVAKKQSDGSWKVGQYSIEAD